MKLVTGPKYGKLSKNMIQWNIQSFMWTHNLTSGAL